MYPIIAKLQNLLVRYSQCQNNQNSKKIRILIQVYQLVSDINKFRTELNPDGNLKEEYFISFLNIVFEKGYSLIHSYLFVKNNTVSKVFRRIFNKFKKNVDHYMNQGKTGNLKT